MVRPITGLVAGVLVLVVCLSGCKSGSANADEVLSERTKKAESAQKAEQDDAESEEPATTEEQGASKNVIRLFDEDEVDDSEGGDIEIESASEAEADVEVRVDSSSCEAFERSMNGALDQLDTSCETDDDCTIVALPCAFGCGRPVASYTNLGQIEAAAERYAEQCPSCERSCAEANARPSTCNESGRCVAPAVDESADDVVDTASEVDDAPAEDSE
jgi:hypothetical protein